MIKSKDRERAYRIKALLRSFHTARHELPGISTPQSLQSLTEQMIESLRRVEYVSTIRGRQISARRADPNDELFDPVKAAIHFQRQGQVDEAFWMVFLFTHFGKHPRVGWQYARGIYGRLGEVGRWDWDTTSADPSQFSLWLDNNRYELKRRCTGGGFGNHRKYQSLDAYSHSGTGAAFATYVDWVGPCRSHIHLVERALQQANGNTKVAFDVLYRSMQKVASFGRTARFDYLAMVGKLDLAAIEPGSPYIQGSTGPLKGAQMLFGLNYGPKTLERWLIELGTCLDVGCQVIEDALCNWQKSPNQFKPFRG